MIFGRDPKSVALTLFLVLLQVVVILKLRKTPIASRLIVFYTLIFASLTLGWLVAVHIIDPNLFAILIVAIVPMILYTVFSPASVPSSTI